MILREPRWYHGRMFMPPSLQSLRLVRTGAFFMHPFKAACGKVPRGPQYIIENNREGTKL